MTGIRHTISPDLKAAMTGIRHKVSPDLKAQLMAYTTGKDTPFRRHLGTRQNAARFTFRLPIDLMQDFADLAKADRISTARLLRALVRGYINARPKRSRQ